MAEIRRRVGGRIIVQVLPDPEEPKKPSRARKTPKKTVKRKTRKKTVKKARKTR